MTHKGELIVVSGFAGTGKGTLMKLLIDNYDNYVLSVSATTRNPRPGEIEGVHYFYKTREEFESMIENGQLLEHAEYVGNYYGTPRSFVEEQMNLGKDVILEIEIQGALKIKEQFPETLLLFVVPPDADTLFNRLTGRGTETEDVVARRMKRAAQEALGMDKYDYIIVNDDLDSCAENMHQIIQSAKYAPIRQADFIKKLQDELKKF